MHLKKLTGVVVGGLSLAFMAALVPSGGEAASETRLQPSRPMPGSGCLLAVELGLRDRAPTDWSGRIELSEGKVVQLQVGARAAGKQTSRWKATTRLQTRKKRAKKRARRQSISIRPVRVLLLVEAPLSATATISTPQGRFSFRLRDVPGDQGKLFLAGGVRVRRAPVATPIVETPTDDDFPTAAAGPDGTVWLAYVAYRHGNPIELPKDGSCPDDWSSLVTKGNGDQVKLLRFDGTRWWRPIDVTAAGLDVWRPSVIVYGGKVVVAWSQNVDGNWDIHLRSYDPAEGAWSPVRRIERPGPDINPAMAASPDGRRAWIAWQGWADGSFDIYAQELDAAGQAAPAAIAASPANEWNPVAAADAKGNFYVAYDTYQKGNYDVHLCLGMKQTVVVAGTSKFEARPHLAVDARGRVWIAYEEAAANWAKDFGTKWTGPSGVPFYLDRRVRLRLYAAGTVRQPKDQVPAQPVATRYGDGNRVRISMPRVGIDGRGRPWLLYRRHALPTGAGTLWNSFATCLTADGWTPPVRLPNSNNLLDNRPALVAWPTGGLAAVYSTDYRGTGQRRSRGKRDNDLFVSLLQAGDAAGPPDLEQLQPVASAAKDAATRPVHPNEAADIERIRRFRIQVGGKTYQLLRGEFHRHTEMTSHRDQDGTFEAIWRYGLDVARMDWIGPGDHDNGNGSEYLWWLTQKQVDMYHQPPTFTPMFTYERSVRYPSGHRNAMFARRGIRPLPRLGGKLLMGSPDTGSPDVKRFYAYLKHFGGICASHTSATNMGTDWRDNDPDVEPVVEIYQGHRQNYEHQGAPQSAKGPGDSIGGYRPAGFVWNALMKGYRLGFEVSSDHVSTHLSYAVVLAEEPTRAGILDAFRRRHCYGAQDNIVLVVRCGQHLMGDQFQSSAPPQLQIQAIGTGPIARVAVVRAVEKGTPQYVYNARPNQQQVSLQWTDTAPVPGKTCYYYVRVEQRDGKMAWASPMWILYRP